jgi:hypothetical protein
MIRQTAAARHFAAIGLALSVCIVSGCGAASRPSSVASVAGREITPVNLQHWMQVLAPEHLIPDPPRYDKCIDRHSLVTSGVARSVLATECASEYRSLRKAALEHLILAAWFVGEAQRDGHPVTASAVDRGLSRLVASLPGGQAELDDSLASSSRTLADERAELEVEQARSGLRSYVIQHAPRVTPQQAARYYRLHIASFHIAEERHFDLIEGIVTAAAGRALAARLARAPRHLDRKGFLEHLARSSLPGLPPEKLTLARQIFAAPLHKVVGPVFFAGRYLIIEVTKVTPAHTKSFATVRSSIERRLQDHADHLALSHFLDEWEARWRPKTSCAPGYRVPQCSQYAGTLPAYPSAALGI